MKNQSENRTNLIMILLAFLALTIIGYIEVSFGSATILGRTVELISIIYLFFVAWKQPTFFEDS